MIANFKKLWVLEIFPHKNTVSVLQLYILAVNHVFVMIL